MKGESFKKGRVTIMMDCPSIRWDELQDLIKGLQKKSQGRVIEVHIGNEVFDA